jgi:heme A synthase
MLSPDQDMLAFGSCLAGLGIFLTGLLALLFRNPDAPRWARPELVAMLICVPVTGMIGFGLGYTAYGLWQVATGAGEPRGLLVLLAVLIVLALAWRVSGIRRRLRDYAAIGGMAPSEYLAALPTLATDEDPPQRPKPRAGSSRRAA